MGGRLLRGVLLLIGLFALSPAGIAQTHSGTPLATCFRAATPGLTPRQLLAPSAEFDCTRSQAGVPSGDYWVRSATLPASIPFMASVRTASVWQRRVTLYALYSDGGIRSTGYTSATTAQHLKLGAVIDLPLPDGGASRPVRLLWHIDGSGGMRGLVVGPRLTGDEARSRDDMTMIALYAGFGGMGLGLLLYNLALWRALRLPFQTAYCAMLACLLIYAASSSGWIEQLSGMDNNLRLRLNNVALASAAASAVLFARAFFEKAVFTGWIDRLSQAVIVALLGSTLAFAALAPWRIATLDLAMTASYALLIVLVVAVLLRARLVHSRYLGAFALAWGVPIVLAGARIAAALNLVGWRFWIDNSTIAAMALEACLSGVAIATRIRLISIERDEAQRQEILARMLADVDPLTGLLNRRALLAQAIGRSGDQTLVIVDIDHFKRVNETIGHDGGDEVLRQVARALIQDLPADALVARLGGEEFAVLTAAASAVPPARLLDRLRGARMPYDMRVTASIGCCTGVLAREADWKLLYRAADRALFEAKAAGRDRARDGVPLAAAA